MDFDAWDFNNLQGTYKCYKVAVNRGVNQQWQTLYQRVIAQKNSQKQPLKLS